MKKKSEPTLIELYNKIQTIGQSTEMPYEVWTCFYPQKTNVEIFGDQVHIGDADYKDVSDIRKAMEWLVVQLGGSVKWNIEVVNEHMLSRNWDKEWPK